MKCVASIKAKRESHENKVSHIVVECHWFNKVCFKANLVLIAMPAIFDTALLTTKHHSDTKSGRIFKIFMKRVN